MNKTKKYSIQFLCYILLIIAIYIVLVSFEVLDIDKMNALFISVTSFFIFILGTLIIAPGLNKDAESFALRFLLLTTVQLLCVFFIIGILSYKKIHDFKAIGFHLIAIVCALLFLQSYLLIRIKNQSKQFFLQNFILIFLPFIHFFLGL